MADKKNETFTVTDRRKFTLDGDVRPDAPHEEEAPAAPAPPAEEAKAESNVKEFPKRAVEAPTAEEEPETGEAVSADETRESAAAYKQSTADIDKHLAGQMK